MKLRGKGAGVHNKATHAGIGSGGSADDDALLIAVAVTAVPTVRASYA